MWPTILAPVYSFKVLGLFLGFLTVLQRFGQVLIVLNSAIYFIVYTTFLFGGKKIY